MDTKMKLLCGLLECGFMDVDYLVELAEEYEIEIDIEEIRSDYGWVDINKAMDYVIHIISDKFIEENEKEICRILEVDDLDSYKSENEMYQVFSNCLDSYLLFYNEKIQELFENSKYRF